MKHLFGISLSILLALFITQQATSQSLLKDLKKRTQRNIEKRVEDRANEKVDKEIDKQLDKVEDALFSSDSTDVSRKNNEKRMTDMIRQMGTGGEPITIEDSYSFDNLIQMHIESFNKNGKKTSEGEFITHLSSDSKSMGYEFVSGDMAEPGLGLIIVDVKNGATIILSEEKGKKTGLVYGLGTFYDTIQTESLNDLDLSETPETFLTDPRVKKTGRTKTIAGFKCEEYKYTDENSVSDIWITQDIKMNTKDFFSMLFKTSLYSHGMGWGYMMEATTVNKENDEKSTMTVTKVDKNSNKKVSMSDYQVTNLGSFAMPSVIQNSAKQ